MRTLDLLRLVGSSGAPTGPCDVFMIAGDSNAVGNGDGYDATLDATSPYIFQWRCNGGTQAPLIAIDTLLSAEISNAGTRRVGFAMEFARAYIAGGRLTPGAQGVLLVPCGVSATAFANNWNGTRVGYFGRWVVSVADLNVTSKNFANAAMAWHASNIFKGVLWMEGVNDVGVIENVPDGSQALADAYTNFAIELDALIAYFRANITGASSATPFIVSSSITGPNAAFLDSLGSAYATDMEAVIAATPSRVGATHCAYFAGAPSAVVGVDTNLGQTVHYNAHGQRTNGQSAYTAYASIT